MSFKPSRLERACHMCGELSKLADSLTSLGVATERCVKAWRKVIIAIISTVLVVLTWLTGLGGDVTHLLYQALR